MTDIPIQNPKTEDIYSFGFDKNLNRSLANNSTGVVYDTVQDAINTGSVLSGGNVTLKTLSIGGLVRQVAPGDDIQAAIDAVNREGGGTVQLLADTYSLTASINMKSNVLLSGVGSGITILDFGSRIFGITAIGNTASSSINVSNWGINGVTVKSSAAAAVIDIDLATSWLLDNIVINNLAVTGSQKGLRINRSSGFRISNCSIVNCGGNGFEILSGNNTTTSGFILTNCDSSGNGGHGYYLNSNTNAISNWSFFNCESLVNTGDGFNITYTSGSVTNFSFNTCSSSQNGGFGYSFSANVQNVKWYLLSGCLASFNTSDGYYISGGGSSQSDAVFLGCISISNTGSGFNIDSNVVSLIGCISASNSSNGYKITGSACKLIGNDGSANTGTEIDISGAVTAPTLLGNRFSSSGNAFSEMTGSSATFISDNNQVDDTQTAKKIRRMRNNSGAGLRIGNVVTLDATANGNDVTTTATNGSNKVFGMELGSPVNAAWGNILIEGYTTSLYVSNGTASISIGDWLSTYSHAYYAKKAVAGDTIFAMALSTPSTGTASINALLVSPRLI